VSLCPPLEIVQSLIALLALIGIYWSCHPAPRPELSQKGPKQPGWALPSPLPCSRPMLTSTSSIGKGFCALLPKRITLLKSLFTKNAKVQLQKETWQTTSASFVQPEGWSIHISAKTQLLKSGRANGLGSGCTIVALSEAW